MIVTNYVVPDHANDPDALVEHLRTSAHSEAYKYRPMQLEQAAMSAREFANAAVEARGRIKAVARGREPTKAQKADLERFDAAHKEYTALAHRLNQASEERSQAEKVEAKAAIDAGEIEWSDPTGGIGRRPSVSVGASDRYSEGVPLTRDQSFTGFVRARSLVRKDEESLDFGRYVRGVVTGNWKGADAERRAMSEGVLSGGGYMVPTILSSELIDRARNQTRVLQAGARIVPMTSKYLDIAKWVGDPTPAWHSENQVISPTDGTVGKVTLEAQSLTCLTVVSREVLEDAPNLGDQLVHAFAQQFALTVDKHALYGTGTAPEIRGVKNTSGITTLSMGANGAAIANYDWLVDSVGTLADLNETANGVIYAPRTARAIGKLKATDNQPLMPPAYLANLPHFDTNQVSTSLTHGTASNASDAFVADWTQLYVGVRTELNVKVLDQRFADTGQIGFLCYWRGDVAVARPGAFAVTTGIIPA